MIFFIFVYLRLLNCMSVDASTPDLKCSVTNYTVHLQITLNTTISTNTTVVLTTRDVHTKVEKTYHQCQVGEEGKEVRCVVWNGTSEKDIRDYYYSLYEVEIVEERSSTIFWSQVIGELNDLMYDCFEEHQIKRLRITCGDCKASASASQCRQVRWQRQRQDVKYDLIKKHSINVGKRIVTENVGCDDSSIPCVYHDLVNLDECEPEDVCVNTEFKPPYKGANVHPTSTQPGRPKLQKCISTRNMCNRKKCDDKTSSNRYIVLGIGTAAGFIVLTFAMVILYYKRCHKPHLDDQDIVVPAGYENYEDNEGVYPRAEANYAYPSLPVDPNYTEIPQDTDSMPSDGESMSSGAGFVHPDPENPDE